MATAPASFTLAKAVILSIDSATVSGAALAVPEISAGRVREYDFEQLGEIEKQAAREHWVLDAIEAAYDNELPLVVVSEEWTPHGISTATYASLCESWGKWLAAIEHVCGVAPQVSFQIDTRKVSALSKSVADKIFAHIVRVNPNTWRNAVFGKKRPTRSEDLKRHAVVYVERALEQPPNLSHNIAEALCICTWASRASEVHERLNKKRKGR